MNRFSERQSRVLNIALRAWSARALAYEVLRPRTPGSIRSLSEMGEDALADLLAHAERLQPIAPRTAVSMMAKRLTMDPRCRIGAAPNPATAREHATRTFSGHFGFAPSVFRAERRFRCALALLADFSTSLASVALDAGFADQAHFTRDFRARTGTSPGAFRRSLRRDS
jgi:transcriptional regulator GlxA family with amidase domain